MSVLTEGVREALRRGAMGDATADVKQLVCDELAQVDPTATIRRTEYFNHTYVPDVVIDWNDRTSRGVFLRFVSSPERLQADMASIGADGPVVLDLSLAARPDRGPDEAEAAAAAAIAATSRSPRLLVTDTEATEHLRPAETQNLVEHLVVSNVLRAGRGALSESLVEESVAAARAGFDAAMNAEPEAVRTAIGSVRAILDAEVERRVERSLQLLWWVGGGDPDAFPVSLPDDMELNPADTRDFLRMVFSDEQDIDDELFWSRLADRMTFDMLVDSGNVDTSRNLNRLMRQLGSRLQLSHVVLDRKERPFPPDDELAWGLSDRFLRLRGPEWVCMFTPHGNRFSQRKDEGRAVPLVAADQRSAGLLVEAAELDESARQVILSRKAVDPGGHRGRSLRDLADGFPDDASVRRITVTGGESSLDVDFIRMLVGADPDTSVVRMAMVATRLLAAIDAADQQELGDFLGT